MYNKHLYTYLIQIYIADDFEVRRPKNVVMYYSVNVFKYNKYLLIKIYYLFIINTLNNIYIYIYTDIKLHSKMTRLNVQFYLNIFKF